MRTLTLVATREERRRLFAVACPWCGAGPGSLCRVAGVPDKVRRRSGDRVRTLDAGCHDARWQAALGRGAPVLRDVVARRVVADRASRRATVSLLAEEAPHERPW